LLPKSILAQGKTGWAASGLCDRRLAVTPWDRFRVWQENYSRVSEPPFTDQLNAAQRAKFYMAKLQELNSQMTEETREESRATYEAALALTPDDYFLRGNFAQFLDQAGDLADAPGEEQQVSDMLPQNPMTPCIVGRLLVRLGDSSGAEKSFLRALAVRGDFVPALNEMGMIRANQQKTDEAAKYFVRALRIDPGSVEADQNWGFMEQNEGNWNQAMSHYQAAANHQPNGPADYFYRAASLMAGHQGSDALNYLNAAVQMDPNFWQARYLFGGELAAEGRIEEAQAQFSEVVHIRPDFAPGHLNNGLAFAKSVKLEKALKEFQTTLNLNPTDMVARQNLEAVQANLQALKTRSQ
ncbi:MAG: tetratricopeptide repeat protein, partial [Verrucomicrobiota bacterium]